jgi:hypothetical protein
VLTADEAQFAKEQKVGVYPSPWYSRFPTVEARGWEVLVVRGAEVLALGRGGTRAEALADAKIKLRTK